MLMLYLSTLDTGPERELFTELYRSMKQPLYRCAIGFLGNAADAEDAVQDVFCGIAERGAEKLLGLGEADRRRFLYVCVRNRSIDMIRLRGKVVSMEELADGGTQLPDDGEDPLDDILSDRETVEAAKRAITKLEPRLGDVLYMHLKGYSTDEMARLLGEKPETVRKRLYRSKRALRKAVEERRGE